MKKFLQAFQKNTMVKRKMRIAQIASSAHPVSARQNKAIYAHTGQLVDGFENLGHEVTIYCNGASQTLGDLRTSEFVTSEENRLAVARYEQWGLISDCYVAAQKERFDIIHSHVTVMTGFFSRLEKKIPTLISIHSPIEDWMKPILLKHKDEKYISFSLAQRKLLPQLNWYANIYHGVDVDLFTFKEVPEDYVLFIGRITHDKGAHIAIGASLAAGQNIRIAGRTYGTESYWHTSIEPHINGTTVRYVGEVSLEEKISLIQNAKAIIFPTLLQETFGYVLIEAMSCGTPVIAFPNGSVPEIIKDGKTGFLVNTEEEMAAAIAKIHTIDRKEVRKRAEQLFSLKKMIRHYDSVYQRAIQENNFKKKKTSESAA